MATQTVSFNVKRTLNGHAVREVQTVVLLDAEMKRKARALCALEKTSLTNFIRKSVYAYVLENEHKLAVDPFGSTSYIPADNLTIEETKNSFASGALDKKKSELLELAFEIVLKEMKRSLNG